MGTNRIHTVDAVGPVDAVDPVDTAYEGTTQNTLLFALYTTLLLHSAP